MFEYRITKYNPSNRIDGRYAVDEWTSFSDVGKSFGKTELTYAKYLDTENAYIDCCIDLLSKAQILAFLLSKRNVIQKTFIFHRLFLMLLRCVNLFLHAFANSVGLN